MLYVCVHTNTCTKLRDMQSEHILSPPQMHKQGQALTQMQVLSAGCSTILEEKVLMGFWLHSALPPACRLHFPPLPHHPLFSITLSFSDFLHLFLQPILPLETHSVCVCAC